MGGDENGGQLCYYVTQDSVVQSVTDVNILALPLPASEGQAKMYPQMRIIVVGKESTYQYLTYSVPGAILST